MINQFLTSLSTVGGLVTAGSFEAIAPTDLPPLTSVAVVSFNGRQGAVTLTSADVNAADTHLAHKNVDNAFATSQSIGGDLDLLGHTLYSGGLSIGGDSATIDSAGNAVFLSIQSKGTFSTFTLSLSQTALASPPLDGLMEYDGSHLYFTIGSTRHTLV